MNVMRPCAAAVAACVLFASMAALARQPAQPQHFELVRGGGISGTFPPAENFDEQTVPNLPADWSTGAAGAGMPWATDDNFSDTPSNSAHAMDFPATSDMTLDTPEFTPVAGQTLTFRHQYNLQTGFDGAVLEISINGGSFADIVTAGGSFAAGGYNEAISSCCGSPIAGRMSWTGKTDGFVDATVNLPAAATGLPTVLRFRTADDDSGAPSDSNGWWVDTIQLAGGAVVTHTVMPSVGTPSGTIAPSTPQTVNDGDTTDFRLTPDSGFHIDTVGGTCGGALAGDVFTTDPVTADCTVIANFAADVVTRTVTPSVGTPSGTIAPSTPQTINDGDTTDFTLTPDSGFHIDTVGGTCGGTLAGNVFTTDPVTADCTVVANFAADGGGVPGTFPPDENFDEQTAPNIPSDWSSAASGAGIPWVTTTTAADTAPNAAYVPDMPAVSDMTLDTPVFTPVANQTVTFHHQYNLESTFDGAVLEISIDGGPFADIVAAGGTFAIGGYSDTISTCCGSPIAGRMAWTGSSDGFIETTVDLPAAAVGRPTVLRFRTADDSSESAASPNGWWIDTIHLGAASVVPSASITPTSFAFRVAQNATASATLQVANAGAGDPLIFSITGQATDRVVRAHEGDPVAGAPGKIPVPLQPATFSSSRSVDGGPPNLRAATLPTPWSPVAPDGGISFALDDGSFENAIGFGPVAGTEAGAVWINRFAPPPGTGAYTIDSISIDWPDASVQSGDLIGLQANLVAYYDADSDGNPANAVRLGSDDLVTIASQGSFLTYPVNFNVPGDGDIYIGFVDEWAIAGGYTPKLYPAPLDVGSRLGRSYVSASATPPTDITNLSNNNLTGVNGSFGFPGNWLIRASGSLGGGGAPCTGPVIPWLAANPASGAVAGGDTTDVAITVDPSAGSLPPGDYTAELCVSTNDPSQSLISVPVSLTVTLPVYAVTPSVGTPSGTIAPSTAQTVDEGATIDFTLTPDAGFHIDSVGGTCGGALVGDVFTTNPVTADCTVIANFAADGSTCSGGDTFCSFEQAAIPDDGYDGSIGSMACTDIDTSAIPAGDTVTHVSITTGITHTWAGDLTAKLISPDGSILGVFSRPGYTEPADDGTGCCGDSSNLDSSSPLSFDDAAVNDAELMGSTIGDDQVICADDGICDYFPDPGSVAVPPANFAGFIGETASGMWTLCVGDSGGGDTGTLDDWTITIDHTGGGVTHTVTPSVGTPSGTIAPSTPQTVDDGTTTDFTLTPDSGFHIDTVGGTCGGNLSGNVFTTAPVTADCTVVANFAADGGGVPGTFPPDENFDEQTAPNIPSDWTTAFSGAGMPWVTDDTVSDTAPNSAHAMDFPEVSDMTLDTPAFTPVANQTVTFQHQYNLESTFDGAVLEISIDGGPFQDILDAGGSFESGGYDDTISSNFSSPIAGRMAWTGDSGGFISTLVDLPAAATGLPTVLRFRTADDASVAPAAPNGWWVDTIHLDVGTPPVPPMATFTPTSFAFSVAEDATANDTLNIANAAGSDPLTFSIAARGTMQPLLLPHVEQTAANTRSLHQAKLHGKGDPVHGPQLRLTSSGVFGHAPAPAAPWAPRGPDGTVTFQADDGAYETSVSLNNGTTQFPAIWIDRYSATSALTIDSISIDWPNIATATGDLTGKSINLVAYYDADANGDPSNAVRLGTDTMITIGGTDVFETYPTAFSVPGAGDVYIGFSDAFASGGTSPILFAAALDENADPNVGWISGKSTNEDPDLNNLANNDLTGTISGLSGGSLPGAWMVRATGSGGSGGPCTGPVVTWMTASPSSGSVNGGANTDVTVTVDPAAGGLTPGDYTAELCATTNDPTQTLVSIPVDVTVTPGAVTDGIFCNGFELGEDGSCG
ncbi:MAG: proprotein convertase P-domain-containing protein, partial [Rhodanobacteraceae bacterium]